MINLQIKKKVYEKLKALNVHYFPFFLRLCTVNGVSCKYIRATYIFYCAALGVMMSVFILSSIHWESFNFSRVFKPPVWCVLQFCSQHL